MHTGGLLITFPLAKSIFLIIPCCKNPDVGTYQRLLGQWGTTPGLNFIYVHLNRLIKKYNLDMIYICTPGHGGPGVVANTYLEGTHSKVYPNISEDTEGIQKLF